MEPRMFCQARLLARFLFLLLAAALSASAQTGPEIRVETASGLYEPPNGSLWGFGDVPFGERSTSSFRIRNIGQEPLTGLTLRLAGATPQDFAVSPEVISTELAPGASEVITITFTPRHLPIVYSTLHIVSNDADEGDFSLILAGAGYGSSIDATIAQGSTVDMGTRGGALLSGFVNAKIFNRGNAPSMILKDIVITGDHPGDFGVVRALPGPLPVTINAANHPYNVTIQFTPRDNGIRRATIQLISDDFDKPVYEFHVTGTGAVPVVQLEQPAGTPLTSPASYDFGKVGPGTPAVTQTFTLRNTGQGTLWLNYHVGSLFIEGTNKADYAIVKYPDTQVAPGQTTTVTVSFFTQALGSRLAYLFIDHNSPLSGPYQIFLSGTSVQSTFEFSAPVFQAWHGDSQVEVRLRRDHADIPASVLLEGRDGETRTSPPFTSALPDLAQPDVTEGWVDFAAGEIEKAVFVPILALPARASLNRHFYIDLVATTSAGKLGSVNATNVRILAADSIKPALTLAAPAAGKVSSLFPLLVTGTASDARGLDRVELVLNAGTPIPLALNFAPSGTASFSHAIEPPNGWNVIIVTAYDLRGNSTTITRNITVERRRRLTVEIVDADMGVSGTVGSPAITATPAASASTFPAPATYLRTLAVVPGTQLKFAVTPKPGYVFDHWDMDTTASWESMQGAALGSDMTLTMPDADLSFVLTFARSPFDPPAGETRNLHWLLTSDGEPATASVNGEGTACLNGTLTSGGGFTGKFLIAGQSVPVTATFFAKARAVFTVAGKKLAFLPCPGGRLEIVPVGNGPDIYLPDAVFTSVTGSGPNAAGPGRRGVQSATKKVRAALLNSAAKGYYTVTLPPPAPAAATPFPAGAGQATVNLTNSGVITFAGLLADGTAFTMGTDLLVNEEALIFSQIPTPGATTKLALLAGLMEFDPAPATSDLTATLNWYRPATTNPKVLLYPAGWPGGLALHARGALYSPAIAVQFALGISSQARLAWSGGGLTPGIEKSNFTLNKNGVVKTSPVDGSYTLALAPATGLFSGTFTPNWAQPISAKPAFKGIILQKGQGSATGFFLNNARNTPADGGGHVILGAVVPSGS